MGATPTLQVVVPVGVSRMPVAKGRKTARKPPRISHTRQPDDLTTPEWQVALRRQYGREQAFTMKNLGDDAVFSEFAVHNPASGGTYRVAIRGLGLGDNYCTCPDFATNLLGTCKHIEFVLGKLERRRGGKTALRRGFAADYSELYLRYGAERHIAFRPGRRCTPAPSSTEGAVPAGRGHASTGQIVEAAALFLSTLRRAVRRPRRSGDHR